MKKAENIISNKRRDQLIADRNRAMDNERFKFYILTLGWVIVFAGVMVFCAMLNAYMVIPSIGHHTFVDVLLYLFVAFTAYVCATTIRDYYITLQHNLNAIRIKYNQPIIKSYATRLAYMMAYGLDFVSLEDAGYYY